MRVPRLKIGGKIAFKAGLGQICEAEYEGKLQNGAAFFFLRLP
jgi:hypothetical protein